MRCATRASCPISIRCRVLRSPSPATSCVSSNAAAAFARKSAFPNAKKNRAGRARLSTRGLGTENRTDPVFVGLQRTRLLDPTLNFLGTNDHPGDYRSSGCTACHVVYANDRSPVHSGPYAKYGNKGCKDKFEPGDPMIPHNESGHPIKHKFTRAIPSSQCITCHVHPGTNVMNSYLGYMWWDEETDGEHMYPKQQKHPTAEEYVQAAMNNPDEASRARSMVRPQVSGECHRAQSAFEAHAVRRLPWPRLGL